MLDVRDPAHREILWTGQTELGSSALLARLATTGWTVVDVGANAGFYTLLAWDLGGRRGRVLAFEPNPRVVAMLRRSVEAAVATGVDVVDAACGDTTGQTALHLSADPGQAAFATVRPEMRWDDDWDALTVAVRTVDEECAIRGLVPDLVKIDAEGAEGSVIEGMSQLLADRVPRYIICEAAVGWHRPDVTAWIQTLRDAGYDACVIGDDGGLNPLERLATETVQNMCFQRRPDSTGRDISDDDHA
jgi:FkbM family methyltransferase